MKALVRNEGSSAGILSKDENGYSFRYFPSYLNSGTAVPVAYTLPLRLEEYHSVELFPFFQNLLSEGWLLEVQSRLQKIDRTDAFRLLLKNGEDLSGSVSILPVDDAYEETPR